MNGFYVSGYSFNKYSQDTLYFDKIVKTEKPRLTEFEIGEIKTAVRRSKQDEVIINFIYKLED